jgi:FKBP-type peptidyl-prolyl cis-trans isomerase FkpA
MKKFAFVAGCVAVIGIFVACNKSVSSNNPPPCTGVEPAADAPALLKFASDSIMLTKDTTGIYYQILDSGAGVQPNGSSIVTLTYTGRLMDNSIFDSATNANLGQPLAQLIPGLQVGLPKIKKGGHIKLLLPSAWAWGCQGSGMDIPSNAPIYFDIHLVDIN